MSDDTPLRFSDEQARAILARAIEMDAQGPVTTIEQLRVIAEEIGVSPASLEMAIREQAKSPDVQRLATAHRVTSRIVALGIPLGITAGWLATSNSTIAMLAPMAVGLVASGGLAVHQSVIGSLRSYHAKNFALWAGALVGSVAAVALLGHGLERGPMLVTVAWCVRSWIATGILGSATMIAVERARRSDGNGPDARAAENLPGAGGKRLARVIKRIRDAVRSSTAVWSPAAAPRARPAFNAAREDL